MRRCTACNSGTTALKHWLEQKLLKRWYSSQPPPAWLRPLAWLYGRIADARRRRLVAQAKKLQVPVIVVGNISLGGTGKTPYVIWLVEKLREWGWKPGVISRGYGGSAKQYPFRVARDSDPREVGDEPAMLMRRLRCPIAVAPDRVAAAQLLIDSGEVDILVSDDGLQHYRLARDLEICVVDGARGLGNKALLPAGPLREPPQRLKEVDLVVINGGGWDGGGSPLQMHLETRLAMNLVEDKVRVLSAFAGKGAHAVAGIGNPRRFFAALRMQGILTQDHPFADHHPFVAQDLAFGDDMPVLMTEKDAVKCAAFATPQHWSVPVHAQIGVHETALVRKLTESLKK